MPSAYNVNTMVTIFNVFDTCGRFFPNLLKMGKKGFFITVFSRVIFLVTFPLLSAASHNHWISVKINLNFF
jgi:hypothetical protein